ncbi:MAG: hypothetical protein SNJ66_13930 [Chloroherpetonaceae bacterium]
MWIVQRNYAFARGLQALCYASQGVLITPRCAAQHRATKSGVLFQRRLMKGMLAACAE